MNIKTLAILLIPAFGISQDTIYTEVGKVVAKKVNITVSQVEGEKLTQVKESLDYKKAIERLESLKRDTTNFTIYQNQLDMTEIQIKKERRRTKQLYNNTVDLIDKINRIIENLKP